MPTTRSFRDSQVLASLPMHFGVDREWGFLGDSFTAGTGAGPDAPTAYNNRYPSQAVAMAGMLEHKNHFNSGNGGYTSAMLIPKLQTDIIANGCKNLVLQCGTNDGAPGGPSVSTETFLGNVAMMVQAMRSRGGRCVVLNVAPSPATDPDAAQRSQALKGYNLGLRQLVPSLGAELADIHTGLVDPTTGYMKASMAYDTVHPNGVGHYEIGKAVAAAMTRVRGTPPSFVDAIRIDAGELAKNPLMAGTVGDGNAATGWYTQVAAVGTVVRGVRAKSGTLQNGQWIEAFMTGAGSVTYGTALDVAGTWSAGDVLMLTYRMEVEDIAGNFMTNVLTGAAGARVRVNQNGLNLHDVTLSPAPALPPTCHVVTVPNATGLAIWFNVISLAGMNFKIRIGECTVLNLTKYGLTNILT